MDPNNPQFNNQPILPGNQQIGFTPTINSQNTPPNPLIVSSKTARREFNNYSNNLSKMLLSLQNTNVPSKPTGDTPTLESTKNDPYMQELNKISVLDDEMTRSLMASIGASRYRQQADVSRMFDTYKRGLEVLGIQSGEAMYTPESLAGKLQQVENQKLAKLQEYDIEANKALMEAKRAQSKGKLDVLRDKMNRLDAIKEERDNYLKDLASNLKAETDIAEDRAMAIYDSLKKLNSDEKEVFLNEVADKYGIPVTSLVSAVSRIAEKKTTKSSNKSTSANKIPTAQASALKDKLNASKFEGDKADGKYANPELYLANYESYIASGGSPKIFFKTFPPATYINPENTELPEEIMKFVKKPKTTSTTSSQLP